ncbi:hypothetical protein CW304_08750 [Bacillus sp. UFRGS-B20]|nr:hypothetical protein CW304_08750 [Bacillus sp. UFRGS-B20]
MRHNVPSYVQCEPVNPKPFVFPVQTHFFPPPLQLHLLLIMRKNILLNLPSRFLGNNTLVIRC